jgi:hypothetical protein
MSASGHLQTFGEPHRMSAIPPKADIGTKKRERLDENIGALDASLSQADLRVVTNAVDTAVAACRRSFALKPGTAATAFTNFTVPPLQPRPCFRAR